MCRISLTHKLRKPYLTGVPFILLVARVDEFTLTWLGENPKGGEVPSKLQGMRDP